MHPLYLKFLHGNFLNLEGEELSSFVTSVNRVLRGLKEDKVVRLLRLGWREQLMGAWWAGLKNWSQFTEHIGGLLIQSSSCYAAQGYCFALASFADDASVEYLSLYLDEYLPRLDKDYDQLWAISALLWVDKTRGTNHGQKYLEAGGLWERFAASKTGYGGGSVQPPQIFEPIMSFRDKWLSGV